MSETFQRIKRQNVNDIHKAEQASAGFNTCVAVALTRGVGSMWTAYSFVVLALIGLFAILGLLTPIVALLVAWTSQTFIQLVLLPVIMVGQNVLNRKAELQSDVQYKDIEHILDYMQHIEKQNITILTTLAQQKIIELKSGQKYIFMLKGVSRGGADMLTSYLRALDIDGISITLADDQELQVIEQEVSEQ